MQQSLSRRFIRFITVATIAVLGGTASPSVVAADAPDYPALVEGEGLDRPEGADRLAAENHVVASVRVEPDSAYGPYTYTFMATPDGASGVVVQGHLELPQPRLDGDVCALQTFLRVADDYAIVPPRLITACADDLRRFGPNTVDFRARAIRANEMRDERLGQVTFGLAAPAPYCSGGDGGRDAFINQRCADLDNRVANTTSTLSIFSGECAIYTDSDGSLNKRARCDAHITGGWLQLTSSLSIFPTSAFAGFTTKTRWQVAACVQPLKIKWKQRFHTTEGMPDSWFHFADVQPNHWAVMTLYSGTASTDYLCSGGDCWTTRDFRVAIDQGSGDGRFRAASGWVAMQGKETSSQCNLGF